MRHSQAISTNKSSGWGIANVNNFPLLVYLLSGVDEPRGQRSRPELLPLPLLGLCSPGYSPPDTDSLLLTQINQSNKDPSHSYGPNDMGYPHSNPSEGCPYD
ncbi:hypothetical protein AMECASPLE_032304 [Ameca splendens]|uniref:Uncharacterized protein n=1 Tax=Ameca splendens TaxID=208324 RepID=A0ABV0XJL1_9TELE